MRLLRWYLYSDTQKLAIQILIYRSKTISKAVRVMQTHLERGGLSELDALQLWTRGDHLDVMKRHPEYFRNH